MSDIPQSFYCPITLEIMKDPVCDKEGNSFERIAIIDWITCHGCSPITRTPMMMCDLVPNRALHDMILQHFDKSIQPKLDELNETQKIERDNIELHAFIEDSKLLITVNPGDSQIRTFLNVSCVIDVSGSMGDAATIPGENNHRESFGLSILDVVKHAVTTIIKSLNSNDRLAIITFSDSANIALPLTKMDENGQLMAISVLTALCPMASTNLWAGLERGLDVLSDSNDDLGNNILSTLMLFTDGVPNIIPPRGHLPMLQMYKDKVGGLPGSINTFGFGYHLDSELLNGLAIEGKGGYSFIPDSGFVGTIFVHAIANLKATIASTCRLTIEPLNGANFENPTKDLGEFVTAQESWGITVDIGSIQTGQTKDIVLEMKNLPPEGTTFASITLTAKTRTNGACKLTLECNAYQSSNRILPNYFRFKFIQVVKNAMNIITLNQVIQPTCFPFNIQVVQNAMKLMTSKNDSHLEAIVLIENLINEMENSCVDVQKLALLKDIQGQVLEGLQEESFQKWGRHYLPSLLYAHCNQICNNFKDIGPQVYGGTLFKKLRDEADTLFCSLPPPKPSQPKGTQHKQLFLAKSMKMFHNSRAVCFYGKGLVRMFDGQKKNVEAIVKGDQIQTASGTPATVKCVVETKISEKMVELVKCPGELLITPWHPIRLNHSNDWIFPISLAKPILVPCESVFNFVLNEHHIINVDGIDSVTLGHSFRDSVCAHDYFGTAKVIDDLKTMTGYDSGLVKVIGVQRDPLTSKVIGLIEG